MEVLLWYALAAAAAVFAVSLLVARYAGRAAARRDRGGYTVFAIFALMLSAFSVVLAWMSGH